MVRKLWKSKYISSCLTYPDEAVAVELCVFLSIFFLISELQGKLHEILILLAHVMICHMMIHDGGLLTVLMGIVRAPATQAQRGSVQE